MLGTTGLHNLRIDCIVGIYPHERDQTQTVFLDIEIDYDFGPAAASDAIPDAAARGYPDDPPAGMKKPRR